jgi:hypothetical protein
MNTSSRRSFFRRMSAAIGSLATSGSVAILNDLTTCAHQGGNYLLNIGPEPDGTVPAGSVQCLDVAVRRWNDPTHERPSPLLMS